MGNHPLKHSPNTNQGQGTLPLLETDHPKRSESDSNKNQGISNDLPKSERVVGPDTTPAAGNIYAKPLLTHPPTNQPHRSLPLPITEHPKEERIYLLENQGISSSIHYGGKGGRVLRDRFQGREGRDTGRPTFTHHLQCGGECGGMPLGHAGSGGGRDAGGEGAGGQAPCRPLLRGQRYGSVVRPPLATVGFYYPSWIF